MCDYDGDTLTIVYKVVGKGTEMLSRMVPEEKLDILTGLGNGYDLAPAGNSPAAYWAAAWASRRCTDLAKRLLAMGKQVTVILGFNTAVGECSMKPNSGRWAAG